MGENKLNLVVDMNGCPNRCLHCWLGHMPNRKMEEGSDRFIVSFFSPYFDQIAYYSWLREPDYCDDYESRWKRDLEISKNTVPERFELASFYRIVRDKKYIPFLQSVGVKKVQLTFFGLETIQDRYVGRKGAYQEVLRATELLMDGGIVPRWQCFINEENREEIVEKYHVLIYPRLGYEVVIPDELKSRVALVDAPIIELSSTVIRERLAQGLSVRYYVPDEVLDYIMRKNLYRKPEQEE